MPTKPAKSQSRRKRAAKQTPPPAAQPSPEQTMRQLLAPLATAALETSVQAYAWGLRQKQLMRASVIMDLCSDVIKQANQMLGHHPESVQVLHVKDVVPQAAAK